jgi:hypothetical protein
MELMNARQEATRTQEVIQKDIEKNTRRIADLIEGLGKMPN